jgi:hypothetical protein
MGPAILEQQYLDFRGAASGVTLAVTLRSVTLAALVLALVPACLAQHLTSATLASQAAANPIAAQRDFAGTSVVVRGVVQQSTLVARNRVVVSGYPYYGMSATSLNEQMAVVVLDPGTVLCYFEPEHIDEAADLKDGTTVDLSGRVESIRVEQGRALAVVQSCRRARP